jgi:hypothetical protein
MNAHEEWLRRRNIELLAANNEYLRRARDAEAKTAKLERELAEAHYVLASHALGVED